ncbi:MAG: Holliday junction resolvase [Candidatus Thermoplasmatota archaeon]|jgi:Holliday junction resolvase|nr:Holliday junction resolvase [Candidatus Sysuiplasma jiujiangense]MBX8639983.1 Holliday junction resolvase [Candidatus Sysuiplasma jiujiangense]MBX8642034.1 Holliday junction resolvase [Candidatus Sysuiplasma jiujiangense]MCL5253066.1 Holliday junction resolvase [Candidatus Thermoplasmatota archaeon]
MGDTYERELKGILGGEGAFIERISRTLPSAERESYQKLRRKHFLVIRAAGSFGVDLLAVRGNFAFPIEVKSSRSDVFRFSRSEKLAFQAARMRELCEQSALVPAYAYRLKNADSDPWRLFTIQDSSDGLKGIQALLFRKLPKIGMTEDGNGIMKWSEGMKLSSFVDYFSEMM